MNITNKSLSPNKSLPNFPINVKSVFPKHRQTILNENGWGFRDSYFVFENNFLVFKGSRYEMCNRPLKKAREDLRNLLGVDIKDFKPIKNPVHKESDYPPRLENNYFCSELEKVGIDYSLEFSDRFVRCRGQALKDFYILRYGKFKRIPDLVVFPKSHEDVVFIVELAKRFCTVLVPYGGGSNTTMSLNYLEDHHDRLFVSLDTTQMCRILWIDNSSMLACVEAGITGQSLEECLKKYGLTLGHEPDSIELSTLGGWVATRSAGMKQRKYGNIEEMVKQITLVTGIGVLKKNFLVPRASIGPDFDCVALGSEGTLGVVTKVVVKLSKYPASKKYGSIMFRNLESGVNFMYAASKLSVRPSSLRLVDNVHVRLGLAFQHNKNLFDKFIEFILVQGGQIFLRIDMTKISLVTYLIEGEVEEVKSIETTLRTCAWSHGGVYAGSKFAERTFQMTMTNCYLRDLFFDLGLIIDSIEPSVIWDKVWTMIQAIERTWIKEIKERKLLNILAFRISQVYDNGACVYFYYGIGPTIGRDQFDVFEELTDILRRTILAEGGCLSHHHGIGKKSLKYYPQAISSVGIQLFSKLKKTLDPQDIFDVGNLVGCLNKAKL